MAAAVSAVFPVAVASLPINALVYVLDGIMVGASEFSFMAAAMVGTAGVTAGALFATESAGGSLRDIWLCLCLLMAGRAGTLYWRYRSGEGALGPVLEVRAIMRSEQGICNESVISWRTRWDPECPVVQWCGGCDDSAGARRWAPRHVRRAGMTSHWQLTRISRVPGSV